MLRQKFAEEAKLRLKIGFHVGVVVEVVAAEIGEGGGREAHAVEALLLDSVRGGLHREMGDPLARELVERAVQQDRVGRRERAIGGGTGPDHAERAQARGLSPERREDLAGEIHDRCLAGRAGHRHEGFGLIWVEPRGRGRQGGPRIRYEDRGCTDGFGRRPFRDDRHGARLDGASHIGETIRVRSGNREERDPQASPSGCRAPAR